MNRQITNTFCVVVGLLALSISGCTKISETFNEQVEATTESETSIEEGLVEKAENLMREFVTAVNLQKYEGIASYVYMPENAFITDENIQWYITRTALADITGISINKLEIDISDGALKKKLTVFVNGTGYAFDMELDNTNTWKIVLPELYVENWSLKIPKGCQTVVNNTSIDSFRVPTTVIDAYDTYTFPAIASQEMEITTTSSIFGSFTQKTIPVADSESIPVICKVSDAETTSILRQIQSIWNALYLDYKNGVEVDTLKKYFTDDFDNTEMTNIMFAYFPALEKSETEKEVYYTNFYMKETIPWTKDNYGCAILNSDNTVLVNFGYRIDFAATSGGSYNTNKVTQITMSYDTEAATYKIKHINDTSLFYDNDYKLNDY